ncbi:hypothetical protein OAV41_02165 [Planctomycetota bacterium]|nr:hypothetical protein [Planctomycetota bacterium]
MASILGVETLQHTNGTDAITIDSSGNVALPQVGTGAFYRNGTFTPAFSSALATDQDASIVSSYDDQYGFYTRIGDLVHIEGTITTNSTAWSFTNGGATGQSLTIIGLPFTIKNATGYYPNLSVGAFNSWTSWTASYTPMGYSVPNTKRIIMTYAVADATSNILTTYIYAIGSSITFSMTYQTDDA